MKLFIVLTILLIQGCKTNPNYKVTGIVLEKDLNNHRFKIDHDKIPGFMDPMIMYFNVHKSINFNDINLMDSVKFDLVITDRGHYSLNYNVIGKRKTINDNSDDFLFDEDNLYNLKNIGDVIDNVSFTKTNNSNFTLNKSHSDFKIISFIFSRCPMPEMCPATISNMQYLAESFKAEDVEILFISFDYFYDTPDRLAQTYGNIENRFKNIHFLSSTNHLNDLYLITKQVGLTFGGIEDNNIGHTMRTVILDKKNTILKIYEGYDWKPSIMKKDLENQFNMF